MLSPISTSVSSRGTGWKPFSLYHCTMPSSPADVYSFACWRSGMLRIGCAEKMCAQPPCPQPSSTRPRSASLSRYSGVSASSTCTASASEAKKNGMPKTLNESSTSVRPGSVRAATWGLFRRMRRMMVASSPVVPRTCRRTRPSVASCQSDAICLRARSQTELAGRIVPSRRLARWATSSAGLASNATATAKRNVFMVGSPRPRRARRTARRTGRRCGRAAPAPAAGR